MGDYLTAFCRKIAARLMPRQAIHKEFQRQVAAMRADGHDLDPQIARLWAQWKLAAGSDRNNAVFLSPRRRSSLSNSNWEHLRGYEDRILVGAEVINGTGNVGLKFYEEAESDKGDMAFFTLTADEALDFARLLSRQAHEALRAQWNERHLAVG